MAHQSPMISIPRKSTDEVDWTTPIRHLIAQSYGESPDNYAAECAALQRCRQDAVRGAGSDTTARDLLYKYFGQLELLELRFSEIKVNFPWRDAFTSKQTTQTSIAYEKASILFQIAATHSAIGAAQSRSDPEGLKRAFHYFKTCAGMLTYINENFLHAPSTDLSRDVINFLVSIILAQATEVFFEKCTEEKKGSALVAKIGAQAASMYTTLCEDVKEFMGKGIFDRNWVTLLQIKSKYFISLSQYHRGLADDASGKHGEALVRFTVAETNGKEAHRLASAFASTFVQNLSPTLPSDAGPSIQERTKAHLALVTERKNEASRENDLIYNAVLPSPDALPTIDKVSVATAIPIQEVYSTPEVQKTIGQDIFIRLVPLSVHESASVYSEEKAKFVRAEVEKTERAESELRSALDGMGVKQGLTKYKALAEGEIGKGAEVPLDVQRWKEDIAVMEGKEGVSTMMNQLLKTKDAVRAELEAISNELDAESRDCEAMRVKYQHLWSQEPSVSVSKSLRQDLKSHFGSLDAAGKSDNQVVSLWEGIKTDLGILLSPQLEDVFIASTDSSSGSLLDFDPGNDVDDGQEKTKLAGYISELEDRLGRLTKISRERAEVLKDLKEKIQNDDVSHLLLLNRRNTGVEPALFAAELEKFKPYQQRLWATIHHQEITLQEVSNLWKNLRDTASKGTGMRKWDEREKKKQDTVRRFSRTRDTYMEVRDGLVKGLQFYGELSELSKALHQHATRFVSSRVSERGDLAAKLEVEKRLTSPPPVPPPPTSPPDLLKSFSSMNLQHNQAQQSWQQAPSASTPAYPSTTHPHPSYQAQQQSMGLPPPPPPTSVAQSPLPPAQQDPYSSLGMFGSSYSPHPPPPPPQVSPPLQYYQQPPNPATQGHATPVQYQNQNYRQTYPESSQYALPPPPPQQQYSPTPPPPPQQSGYQGYQPSSGYGAYGQGYGR